MKLTIIFGLTLLVCSTVYAQSGLVGNYKGNYPGKATSGEDMSLGIGIEIKSVEGNVIKGTIARTGAWVPCRGESPAEGKIKKNDEIDIKALEEIGPPGCGKPRFKGLADGNSLVGKWGSKEVKLNK